MRRPGSKDPIGVSENYHMKIVLKEAPLFSNCRIYDSVESICAMAEREYALAKQRERGSEFVTFQIPQ